MSSHLHAQLSRLATSFADSVLAAIRAASLEELLAESRGDRARGGVKPPSHTVANRVTTVRASGRLARRSPQDIAKAVDRVVGLLKRHKTGLRAEQIREELGLLPKEMPRVLKEGLSSKKLTSKGQKRATTYFSR